MEPLIAVIAIFIGLPWVILHYLTKWKTAATITNEDEVLLEELYQLARRLDERMETVERLVAADDPAFTPPRIEESRDIDTQPLRSLEGMLNRKGTRA